MKVLTEVGEIDNVVIRHKGTGCRYRKIVGGFGYHKYEEAPEEGNTMMVEIKDIGELEAMIGILLDFRGMMLDGIGKWEPKRLNGREMQGYKEKIARRRKR